MKKESSRLREKNLDTSVIEFSSPKNITLHWHFLLEKVKSKRIDSAYKIWSKKRYILAREERKKFCFID